MSRNEMDRILEMENISTKVDSIFRRVRQRGDIQRDGGSSVRPVIPIHQ